MADQAIEKLKAKIRELTRRTRGHRLSDIVQELKTARLQAHTTLDKASACLALDFECTIALLVLTTLPTGDKK